MNRVTILTPWAGSGTLADPYRPAVMDHYPGHTWEDKARLPGGQGTPHIEAQLPDTVYQALVADPRYGLPAILSVTAL
jgi:hypothetical protein